jgi:hypothetical protein
MRVAVGNSDSETMTIRIAAMSQALAPDSVEACRQEDGVVMGGLVITKGGDTFDS